MTFELIPENTYTVTATVASGQGGVSCSPASVNDSGTASSTCTAVPEDGWQVSGWTDACSAAGTNTACNLTNITGNRTSTVSFSKRTFSVVASVVGGNGLGSVSCTPSSVEFGATSTCVAVPITGYRVKAWTGDCSSADTSTHIILMDVEANKSSTVSFEPAATPIPVLPLWGLGLLGLLVTAATWVRRR